MGDYTIAATVLPTSARTGSATDWCALLGNRLKCLKGAYICTTKDTDKHDISLFSQYDSVWMILSVDITCDLKWRIKCRPWNFRPPSWILVERDTNIKAPVCLSEPCNRHSRFRSCVRVEAVAVRLGWVRPNEPSGFRERKELLNRASALVTTCP